MQQAILFPTCVIDAVRPEVGMATARVLQRMRMTVEVQDSNTCCAEEAATVARTTLAALSATERDIIVPAGSCSTMIRVFWRELFEVDELDRVADVASLTFEFSELVHTRGIRPGLADDTPSVYHRSRNMLLLVNGELMQDSSTSKMLFGVDEVDDIVSFDSQGITFEPGDLIATGTPAGVGFLQRPPRYLAPGDAVRVGIDRIGYLENLVA